MNDLISRQAALQAMDTWDKFGCGPDGRLVRCNNDSHYVPYVHYDDMVHAIEHLPSAEPEKVCIARINLSEEQVCEAVERAKNEIVQVLSPTESEQPPEIQDILNYLNTVLHPIISPENWDVYSELYDMISTLSFVHPERKTGKWIDETFKPWGLVHHPYKCNQCGEHSEMDSDFCPYCGAEMKGEQDETN